MDPLYSIALLTGLFGSAHCLGMCGGLVSALSLTADGRNSGAGFHILYNLGRILTYALIGLLAGLLGSSLTIKNSFMPVSRLLLIGSDLLIILVGLGSAGLFSRLNIMSLEFSGPFGSLSRAVKGLRKWPPVFAALPLGFLFGFLPCGFLYAMVLTAAQTTNAARGAITMAAFGLGTMPALFLVGGAAQWFSSKREWMLKAAGVLVALMGCYNLFRHIRMLAMAGGMLH